MRSLLNTLINRQRVVYIQFESRDQSLDKTSFNLFTHYAA